MFQQGIVFAAEDVVRMGRIRETRPRRSI